MSSGAGAFADGTDPADEGAPGGAARPALRLAGNPVAVTPKRIARARWSQGSPVLDGAWQDYRATSVRAADAVFDCYGDADNDPAQYPDDVACGQDESRWYFGSSYCNTFVSNDMELVFSADGMINGVQIGWYWSGNGDTFYSSPCLMLFFTQESGPNACEGDSFDYPGVVLDLGDIPNGHYFVLDGWADLTGFELKIPSGGKGSYIVIFANELTSTSITFAECAQPMLWGCSNNGGDPGRPGVQLERQLDDVNPLDGTHEISVECYSYDYSASGVCPGVLGAMVMFRGIPGDYCNFLDFDSDGGIDTHDVIEFLIHWNAQRQGACDPTYEDCSTNCNKDHAVNTQDVACYLSGWAECRD